MAYPARHWDLDADRQPTGQHDLYPSLGPDSPFIEC
jgi:hypothetical protein